MKISCPSCDASLNAPERLVGKRVKCPSCGEAVLVEDPDAAEELDEFLDDEELEESPPVRRGAATQTCPMCGGRNSATAGVCKQCGEELRGGDETVIGEGIWRDGKKLVMRKTAELPYRCVKTNEPADGWLKRKLYWHHPAVYLALLANLLIYAILALCLRKKADIQVGLSHARFQRRFRALCGAWFCGLAGPVLFIVGIIDLDKTPPGPLWPLMPIGFFGGLIGLIICLVMANVVSAAKITDEFVWVKGVHPEFLASFPDWPGEEEMTPKRKGRR